MNLLHRIQESAMNGSPVEDLLLQCLALASRLSHNPLRNWVECELNGYPSDVKLPDYRVVNGVMSYGYYSGYTAKLPSQHVPLEYLPEDIRSEFAKVEFYSGITEIARFANPPASLESATAQIDWPYFAVMCINSQIDEGRFMNGGEFLKIWKLIPATKFVNVVTSVRSKVLNFALDIEKEDVEAGEATPGKPILPETTVTQIFLNVFHGYVGNVVAGSHDFEQNYGLR